MDMDATGIANLFVRMEVGGGISIQEWEEIKANAREINAARERGLAAWWEQQQI